VGKEFVYFIAAKLLREAGQGPAILISPLLALMRNQIAAATRMGVRAATIHSDNKEEWSGVEAALHRNEVDILFISPERLANERLLTRSLKQRIVPNRKRWKTARNKLGTLTGHWR
jgi:ATP-dependent DNA helicase RecQ